MSPLSEYLLAARDRAQRRKSPWNLVLIPAVVLPLALLWASLVVVLEWLHVALYAGQPLVGARGIGPVLLAVAPFFAALPLAMLGGNFIVRSIGPARRALDQEASARPDTGFAPAQRQLWRLAMISAPLGLGVALLGALLPWQ